MQSMTIGTRLGLGFGLVLLLMLALTLFGIQRVHLINTTLTEMTEVNSVKQRHAINFRGSVHDRAIALRDVTLVTEPSDLNKVLADIRQLSDFYRQSKQPMDQIFASAANVSQQERQLLNAIHQIEQGALPLAEQVIQLRQQGEQQQAQRFLLQQVSPAFVDWLASINAFIDFQEDRNQRATDYAEQVGDTFAITMVLLTVLAIILGGWTAFLLTRFLKRALGGEPDETALIVSRIAEGDLTQSLRSSPAGSMLAAVGDMQQQLRHTLSEVILAAEQVSKQSFELDQASQDALQASEVQASSSTASAASIEQMTASLKDVAGIVQQTENNSEKTAALSEQGAQLVNNAAHEIGRVAETVQLSSEKISSLQQRSKDIAGIANVIRGIAEQTNLLALNAAIEAARAGESGRGFAVVADEVRQLAERTSKATTEIGSMIQLVQDETEESVQAMETAAPRVAEGLALAKEAASMLEQIRKQAIDSLENVRDVSRVSTEQSAAVAELAQHIEHIADMSRETSVAMQQNRGAVASLQQVASGLTAQVNRFRTQ